MSGSAQNSLLLLAVKRSMNMGLNSVRGGTRFRQFYGISTMETSTIPMSSMGTYVQYMIDDISSSTTSSNAAMMTEISNYLYDILITEAYTSDYSEKTSTITFYDRNIGYLNCWMHRFTPINNWQSCLSEEISISSAFRLPDSVLVTHHSKKFLFWTRTWTERKVVPAVVVLNDYVNALCLCLAPLVQTSLNIQTPTNMINDIKTAAQNQREFVPSDAERRTVYDPIKKMSTVINDPEILRLIPPRLEITNGVY